MQTKDGKDTCQPYRCSILSENYNGEPIAFEWKIFSGTTASELVQKIQKGLEGQRIDLDKKGNEDSCIISSRKIKMYASRFIDGHWVFLGPGEESKWFQGYAVICGKWGLRASPIVDEFENSGKVEILSTSVESSTTLIFFSELSMRRISSVFTEQSQSCVKKQPKADSGKASKGRPESARRTPRENQIKQEERKSLVDIPRLPHASGNRMLQNLENFESMPFMGKIESLRAAAKFIHPIEIGNYYVTTLLEDDGWGRRTSMCKEHTAPRNQKDSRPFASIDAIRKN